MTRTRVNEACPTGCINPSQHRVPVCDQDKGGRRARSCLLEKDCFWTRPLHEASDELTRPLKNVVERRRKARPTISQSQRWRSIEDSSTMLMVESRDSVDGEKGKDFAIN